MSDERAQLMRDAEAARRRLNDLLRKKRRMEYVLGIPMWEHLVYFIVALAIVLWARKVHADPIKPYALVLAATAGITAILRPVMVAKWHLNRHHVVMRSKDRIAAAEADLSKLETLLLAAQSSR
ncbi:hypothetical protein F1C58_16780 (plasmid) [Glaciihabitans sp. INWT7]|uniref:hypothetical protein n=1 Tax=Glaciihabitans sp. INWT7 TaxID=2596912 RepID=UPI0016255C81|nr:hypothetical protein [Glaciihabitans sp. INWT7]QNE48713.1 hypothetical protein F1C58_16780 [Glaciihabitans sp. INWT7]